MQETGKEGLGHPFREQAGKGIRPRLNGTGRKRIRPPMQGIRPYHTIRNRKEKGIDYICREQEQKEPDIPIEKTGRERKELYLAIREQRRKWARPPQEETGMEKSQTNPAGNRDREDPTPHKGNGLKKPDHSCTELRRKVPDQPCKQQERKMARPSLQGTKTENAGIHLQRTGMEKARPPL